MASVNSLIAQKRAEIALLEKDIAAAQSREKAIREILVQLEADWLEVRTKVKAEHARLRKLRVKR